MNIKLESTKEGLLLSVNGKPFAIVYRDTDLENPSALRWNPCDSHAWDFLDKGLDDMDMNGDVRIREQLTDFMRFTYRLHSTILRCMGTGEPDQAGIDTAAKAQTEAAETDPSTIQ